MESTAQAMFKFTGYVMAFAPVGVFAAIAATVGSKGLGILLTLGKLVGLMYLGLVIFALIVLGTVSYLIRVPFLTFVKAIREPMLIAFTTASSEAALPKSLEIMERFGVPKNIVGFVLPTGYSFNLDGSTLYLSLCSVFVAQMAGVQMTLGQQLVMMLTLMLTSKGVAGVPRAALVVLAATLATFNLPLEGAAILLAIDQIMDMGRTAVNVMGNCIATAVVARWEGVFDDDRMRAFAARRRIQGGLMRIAVVGARGQLGAALVHEFAAGHDTIAFGRAELDISDAAAVAAAMARVETGRDPQRGGVHERRRRRGSADRCAEQQRLRCAGAGTGGQGPRRGAGPLQHRLRVRRTRDHAVRRDRSARIPRASTPRRSCWASGSPRTPRAPTCCASKASSAETPGAGPAKGSAAAILKALTTGAEAKVFEDRVITPSHVSDVARATRQLIETQAPAGLYHCVNSGPPPGTRSRRRWRASWASSRV